jgi:dipeptidyl aminopeptidase/acylaminoacyl peptidase
MASARSGTFSQSNACTSKSWLLMENLINYGRQMSCYLVVAFGMIVCTASAQHMPKKPLSVGDYSLWSTLRTEELSADGQWVSYKLSYKTADTLFVKNTKTMNTLTFPGGTLGKFLGSSHYAFLDRSATLTLVDLNSGKRQTYENVLSFDGADHSRLLVLLTGEKDRPQKLKLISGSGIQLIAVAGVDQYRLNSSGEGILYSTVNEGKYKVGVLLFKGELIDKTILSGSSAVKKLTWAIDGSSVAFLSKGNNEDRNDISLVHYQLASDELKILKAGTDGMPSGSAVSFNTDMEIRIAASEHRVFFGLDPEKKPKASLAKNVEIWHAGDTILYPMRKAIETLGSKNARLAVWHTHSGQVYPIGIGIYDWAKVLDGERYVVSSDEPFNARFSAVYPARDYYLTCVSTGQTELLLAGLVGQPFAISVSPKGGYLAYYKADNWWIYDIKSKKHRNCTLGVQTVWDNRIIDPDRTREVLGVAGWSTDGRLLVYDKTDIWAIDPLLGKAVRITQGKEHNLRYRVALKEHRYVDFLPYEESFDIVDLGVDLFLYCKDLSKGAQGYALRKPNGKLISITGGEKSADRLFSSHNQKVVLYEEQSFDLPPRLVFQHIASGGQKVLVQSNPHHFSYVWGHSEVISYPAADTVLKAAVFYPPNYDKAIKYPMITYIYENLHQEAYQYVNPSVYNSIGFNISNLVSQGYILLLPDIIYKDKNPGKYIVDCVSAAVAKLVSTETVNPARIGLYGHSFGGFETDILLAKTNLFAAGVSGSGISDPITGYLTYSNSSGTVEYWRYEDYQNRMRTPLYDDIKHYIENSPLMMAGNIKTPLLSWAGKDDRIVSPLQTMLLYGALRRLKRDHTMLLYPSEGHTLTNLANQADLTDKVENWFGYYLKGEEPANWIAKGAK